MTLDRDYVSVGEAARILGCPPGTISQCLYSRRVDVSDCPIIGGRRLIARKMLPEIARVIGVRGGGCWLNRSQ